MTTSPRILNRAEMRTFITSAIGGALEFYDFVVYMFFATIIAKLFFDAHSEITGLLLAFNVYASGYVARFFGGLVFSHFGDKKGRKKSFIYTVFLMAIPTFLIGVLPTYAHVGMYATAALILCRIAQGLAIGGEIPCSITFVFEHAPKNRASLACGILFAGIILGIALGSMTGALTMQWLSTEQLYSFGWRLPFLLGGVLGGVGLYLRKKLAETPVFLEMQKEQQCSAYPLLKILREYKWPLWQTTTACLVAAVAVILNFLYMPTYLQTFYHFHGNTTLFINSSFVIFYSLSILAFAKLGDKYGEKRILMAAFVSFILLPVPMLSLLHAQAIGPVLIFYSVFSLATAAVTSSAITYLAKTYPRESRYSGSAFSYNLAFGVLGGFTPLIVTELIHSTGLTIAPGFYMSAIALLALICNLKLSKSSLPQREPEKIAQSADESL